MTQFLNDAQRVTRDIPNATVEQRELGYLVESGVRATDSALVIHLFPLPSSDSPWQRLEMTRRLERALPQVFDTTRLSAGYTEEFDSFYVIAGGYGNVPDHRGLVRKFLSVLDAPL